VTDDADAQRPWDRGLQPERTALAWQRTGLATAAAALAALRLAVLLNNPVAAVMAAVALGGAVGAAMHARLGYRRLTRRLTLGLPAGLVGPPPVQVAAVVLLGIGGVLLAVG
jgi:uncharacterized membrane protein YidH (DUF202 family)